MLKLGAAPGVYGDCGQKHRKGVLLTADLKDFCIGRILKGSAFGKALRLTV